MPPIVVFVEPSALPVRPVQKENVVPKAGVFAVVLARTYKLMAATVVFVARHVQAVKPVRAVLASVPLAKRIVPVPVKRPKPTSATVVLVALSVGRARHVPAVLVFVWE